MTAIKYVCNKILFVHIHFAMKKGSHNVPIGGQIETWNRSIIKVLTRKEEEEYYYRKVQEQATTYFQSDSICDSSSGFNRYFDQIGNQFGKVHLFPFVILPTTFKR